MLKHNLRARGRLLCTASVAAMPRAVDEMRKLKTHPREETSIASCCDGRSESSVSCEEQSGDDRYEG